MKGSGRGRPKNPERIYYDELFDALDIPYIKRGNVTYYINPFTGKQNLTNLKNLRQTVEQMIEMGVMTEEIRYSQENKPDNNEIKEGVEEKIESTNFYNNPTFSVVRDFLKENKGSMVRLVIYKDSDIILDKTYRVPEIGFGGFWHELSTFDLMVDSDKSIIPFGDYDPLMLNRYTMETFVIQEIKGGRSINQNFNDGIKHCILYPIKNWANGCFEESKSDRSKRRYKKILQDVKGLMIEYKEGVPETHLQRICELLQIDIKVDLPLNISDPFIYYQSTKKRLKTFEFINTRLHHVDLNEVVLNEHIDTVSRDEIYEIKRNLDLKCEYYIYQKDMRGVSSLTSFEGKYAINSEYNTVIRSFEEIFNSLKIDDIEDEKLSDFVKYGTHYNSVIDFKDVYPYTNSKNVKHIDMEKAYANFHKCKWYEGFLGKITDFRKCSEIVEVGLYLVDKFDFSKADPVFKKYNDIMRIYFDNNVYPSPELKMLSSFGVKYYISGGCWGVKAFDFRFNEEMLEKKDNDGIRFYARWTGGCDQHKLEQSFYMRGDYDLFQNIRNYVSQGTVRWVGVDEGCISYKKENNYHLGHITAFITMYQRLSVIEQLMEMDITKVIRVCVDAIYYLDHTFKMCNVFRVKKDMNFRNEASDMYASNIHIENDKKWDLAEERDHFTRELHIGAGGTGKTHLNLTDKGFIRVLYVAPSRKLVRQKCYDYSIRSDVLANLIINDVEKYEKIYRYFNVLVLDEVSMYNESSKKIIFDRFDKHKLIFCGDIGYQLPSWNDEPINTKGFDKIISHMNNYRLKCEELRKLCDLLRGLIKEGIVKNKIEDYDYRMYINKKVERFFIDRKRMIDRDELKELYDIKDYILVGTKEVGMEYTEMFKGTFAEEKYYITKNTCEFSNGDIVYSDECQKDSKIEIRHHFTTHSIQGETIETKIFIDCSKMFDSRMFYTAISRARRLDQIYLIK